MWIWQATGSNLHHVALADLHIRPGHARAALRWPPLQHHIVVPGPAAGAVPQCLGNHPVAAACVHRKRNGSNLHPRHAGIIGADGRGRNIRIYRRAAAARGAVAGKPHRLPLPERFYVELQPVLKTRLQGRLHGDQAAGGIGLQQGAGIGSRAVAAISAAHKTNGMEACYALQGRGEARAVKFFGLHGLPTLSGQGEREMGRQGGGQKERFE